MSGEIADVVSPNVIAFKPKQITTGRHVNIYHLFCIALVAFWTGVVFTSITLSTRVVRTTCKPPDCADSRYSGRFYRKTDAPWNQSRDDDVINDKSRTKDIINDKSRKSAVINRKDRLVTRKTTPPTEDSEYLDEKRIILLYGDEVWTKYDKWQRYDWRKCPQKYSNCRITTDPSRLHQSAAVVYNAAKMPPLHHVEKMKKREDTKRVFLSGLTPLRTKFSTDDYTDFFDLTVTYKSESDVRIPYWPNDGILPSMYRPKPGKPIGKDEMLDLEDDVKHYFKLSGKDAFMGAVVTNCEDDHYPNLFTRKLQEEGLIHTYALNSNMSCVKHLKGTTQLPCKGMLSDDCVKHFETFKYIITPDDDLCKDYTSRAYWASIFAWQAVPLLYGSGDYKKHLIPNSYIDCVGNEDYISPSFKKAYYPGQDAIKYYKTYHLWRHEERVEKYHWQCELCRELHQKSKRTSKIDMKKFWNKDLDCGVKLPVHELMRLQLVRTGVIR